MKNIDKIKFKYKIILEGRAKSIIGGINPIPINQVRPVPVRPGRAPSQQQQEIYDIIWEWFEMFEGLDFDSPTFDPLPEEDPGGPEWPEEPEQQKDEKEEERPTDPSGNPYYV